MTVPLRQGAIVAGVDGSASALQAVRWAAREAVRRHAPLRLVHVSYLVPEPPRHHPDELDVLLDQPRQWLVQAADVARTVAGQLEITTDLRDGTVSDAFIEESTSARLIVLGQRGLAELSDLLLGSVPPAVAAHAHCPVVVVRSSTLDSPPPAGGPVVVGVDGTELSDAAVAFAFDAAASRDVPLVAIHALPKAINWGRLAELQEKDPDVEVRRVVVKDRPAHALLDAAREAQLLVVGSRGHGTLASIGLGSVSHTLLRHAPCPIAVVR